MKCNICDRQTTDNWCSHCNNYGIITDEYINWLKDYLLTHSVDYFFPANMATTYNDVKHFRMKKADNILYAGDYFLCDVYSNELWICKLLSKKVYLKRRQQRLNIEPCHLLLDNCQSQFFRFNGLWILPKRAPLLNQADKAITGDEEK